MYKIPANGISPNMQVAKIELSEDPEAARPIPIGTKISNAFSLW